MGQLNKVKTLLPFRGLIRPAEESAIPEAIDVAFDSRQEFRIVGQCSVSREEPSELSRLVVGQIFAGPSDGELEVVGGDDVVVCVGSS